MDAVAVEAGATGGGGKRASEREMRVLEWPLEAKPRLILSLFFSNLKRTI